MRIARNGAIREALLLVSKGIPFDVAFSLEDVMRQGFCIALGELEGGTFNWNSMEFEEPKEN